MSFPIVLALGGARFSTLEVEIFTQVHVLWDYETGAALAALQAVLSLTFVYWMLKLQGDPAAFGGRTPRGFGAPRYGAGFRRARWAPGSF